MVIFITATHVYAQADYSNLQVDQLTDAQVKQMMQRADEMGYTDEQLTQLMSENGLGSAESRKLLDRMKKIRADASKTVVTADSIPASSGRQVNGKVNKSDDSGFKIPKSRVFGADLFTNNDITFEPDMKMATPKGYVIGPDDELLLDLNGDNEASYKLRVSPEGFISMEYVGRIAVGGLTIEQATSKIRSAMSATYPGLRSGRSQIALNLGNIRSIKVIITGEVTKPGTYTLPSLATVFNALYASGGPNERGSFRNIQIIRNNQVISTIDIYDFLLKGFQTGNIRLQDQDVIHVPVYTTRVDVVGEVKRSAIFEVLPHETFIDVLRFAGGFSDMAYTARVKVSQTTDIERKILDVPVSEFGNYHPKNGDKITVEPILERYENKVQINGAVFRPGNFQLTPGLTLSQLIKQAEGVREDAFMNRGYITRLNPDNTTSIVPFDVDRMIRGLDPDIALQREDIVQINSIFDLREAYNVTISGEVRNPGTFKYSDNMSVKDIIQMAGGFKEGATPSRIEVSRRVKYTDLTQKSARTSDIFVINVDSTFKMQGREFILQPYDMVSVRSSEGYTVQKQVKIEGEVLYPGNYTINYKNERISDIVKRAGGLTAFAFPEGASLTRPSKQSTGKSKNDINDRAEEQITLSNLERLKQEGASGEVYQPPVASDLVGIELKEILKNPQSKYDLILEDSDVIRIPSLLQTIKVTGEVLRPSSVVYVPGKPFIYYINSAGGFTRNAFKRGSFITYANGAAAATAKSLFANNYPKVKPGAEIAVPKRAERERMTTQAVVGLTSGLVSLAAIIVALLK